MGSSLILTGGAATTKTLKESISLSGHGFAVGTVIRYNPSGTPKLYVPAQADSAENAEVLGIVNAVTDANTFELTYGGYLEMPAFSGISFPVMFLSGVCAGGLTSNPPSALGQVIKPVATKHPTLNGFVLNNYLGTQIGGSSTVGIDQVQPVGTIMPYAGTVIPDTWLACDGSAFSTQDYPELYSKLSYSDGDRVPMYGYIVELTLSSIPSGTLVGDFVLLPKDGQSFPASITDEETQINPLILVEGQIQSIDTVNKKILVTTSWKYNTTKKYFEYTNAAFKAANNYTIIFPSGWSSANVRGTINGITVTSATITHFLTPDLSSRFIVGAFGNGFAGQPENATFSLGINSLDESRGTTYAQGAFGGEERHTLTTDEMASHSHGYSATNPYDWNANTSITDYNKLVRRSKIGEVTTMIGPDAAGSGEQLDVLSSATLVIGATGGNAPHNNIPPYLAVRYIIKAKPYTRAAIIDGVDLPWQSTLVRDLRTRAIGGSNSDLVFYTNTAGDSGLGTERMRIYGNGNTGDILFSGAGDSTTTNPLILSVGGTRININRDDAYFISTKQDGTTVGYFGFNGFSTQSLKYTEWEVATRGASDSASVTRLYINQIGNVGIGTQTPAVKLDVVGQARTSVGTTAGSNAKTLTTKDYVETFVGVTHGSFTVNASEYTEALLFSTDKPTGAAKDIYTFPTGTVLLTGNFLAMIAGSVGVRLYADFLDASNNIVLRVFLCGANDLVGSITGSNGTMRIGWCTCVPKNATKIKFYPASIPGSTNTLSSVYDVRVNNALVLNI
jgi:microcystin-dependent protein